MSIDLTFLDGTLSRSSIDYPVPGVVKNIKDFNSITDARIVTMSSVGSPDGMALNNAEIDLENIKLNQPLSYIIIYNLNNADAALSHLISKMFLADRDRYKISYDGNIREMNITKQNGA